MKKIFGLAMTMVIGLVMATVLLLSVTVSANGSFSVFEKTDRFNVIQTENGLILISQDGKLVINVDDNTEIIFEDGTNAREYLMNGQTLAELLDNRNLIISYSITTRSLPAQTTPEKIVILYEIAVTLPADVNVAAPVGIVPPIYEFSPEEIETLFPLPADVDV
ncbi:MAG: hypothetical protein FWG55_00475, partial [Candidatus Bathyarchaeota archaeon]|nr:hypothetical protein [Candidatus Termiticorpusculum sp.]